MSDQWFVIKDIEGFVNTSRQLVFQNFDASVKENILPTISEDEQKELDTLLSYQESWILIKPFLKKQKHKKNGQIRFKLSDDIYFQILESLNGRLLSNILNGLVNKGLVETAYDSDANDFIFWLKKDDPNEKPKTS